MKNAGQRAATYLSFWQKYADMTQSSQNLGIHINKSLNSDGIYLSSFETFMPCKRHME